MVSLEARTETVTWVFPHYDISTNSDLGRSRSSGVLETTPWGPGSPGPDPVPAAAEREKRICPAGCGQKEWPGAARQ